MISRPKMEKRKNLVVNMPFFKTLPILLNYFVLSSTKLSPVKNIETIAEFRQFLDIYLKDKATNILVTDEPNQCLSSMNELNFLKTDSAHLSQFLGNIKEAPQTYTFVVNYSVLENTLEENSKIFSGKVEYLVVTNESVLVQDIAKLLWESRLFHSHIISVEEPDCIFALHVLEVNDCGSTAVATRISALRDRRVPNQFTTCPIHVVWSLMPPWVNGINTSWDGIYVEIMKVFSFVSNREIIYRPYNPVYLEEISEAYNYGSLLEDFSNEYAQIFVGPNDIQVSTILDTSPVIAQNSLLFLTPRPIVAYWQAFLSMDILHNAIVVIIIHIFLVGIFYLKAKETVDKIIFSSMNKTCFLMFGIILNYAPIQRLPKNGFLKLYLGAYLLQSVVFSTYIQGVLVSSLSGTLYGKPVDSIEALLESNLPVKLLNGLGFLFRLNRNSKARELFQRIETLEGANYPFEAGNIAVRSRHFATIIDHGYLIMRPNILKSFNVFETFNIKQALAMPKNAYFVNQYNEWFSRIIEIGIVPKFMDLYRHHYALKYFVEEDRRNFVVTFDQIRIALLFTEIGYFLAFAAFLLEVLVSRYAFFRRFL